MRILLIDHEDSFVHNIEQALRADGAEVVCLRCTAALATAVRVDPDGIVLSPGPGHPRDRRVTGLARALLARWDTERPFFGVCLGHQLIGDYYGGRVGRAPEPVHGEVATVRHDGAGVFRGIPSPLRGARYHSLVVDAELPDCLEESARGDGVLMGLRHRELPAEGGQFHPESVLTEHGKEMLMSFMEVTR